MVEEIRTKIKEAGKGEKMEVEEANTEDEKGTEQGAEEERG